MAKKNKHPELDKWQKEIEKLSFFEENAVNKKLFNHYRQALIDIKMEMKVFMDNYETLSFSKKLEAERLLENGKQIDKILRDMNKEVNNTIEKFVKDSAVLGFNGTWYALEGITGVSLDMNMLPERFINELVNSPVNGQRFSNRLYKQSDQLAKQTTSALLDVARTGKSYAVASKNVAEMTEASYKQALRIARTEGGRVQSTTKQQAYLEAKEKGVDIQKQWMSTLDKKTRDTHQHLDGQVVDVEDKFESLNGYKADAPRLFGVAKEDINCRCTTIAVVDGISPELRRDNTYGDTFPYKNYKEWYNKTIERSSGAVSGALNNQNDPDGEKRYRHAERYYDSVRNRNKNIEIKTVSRNTGVPEKLVSNAYHHVFINEYQLVGGISRFDPDYNMALSWQRLREGKNILEHDKVLLYHEIEEYKLMNEQGLNYREAHEKANNKYNYEEKLMKWINKRGE